MTAAALAQETIEEITVTAQRRSESAQRVPLTINAFTGQQLEASGVRSTLDLQNATPGFVFKTNTAFGQPYIRGVGSDLVSASSDSSVATLVDDVYQSRPVGSIQHFFDIDRVEVVKGPQSTLFGRNVTGGAVRIFSKTPEDTFSAQADVLYGNYDQFRVRAAVNVPLSEMVALRVAGMSSTRHGYSRNIFLERDVDDLDTQAVRASLAFTPSENVKLTIIGDYSTQDDAGGLANWPDPTCCVSLGLVFGGIVPEDPREVTHDVEDFQRIRSTGLSSKLEWSGDWGSLTSVTGYRKVKMREGLDLDATNIPFANNFPVLRASTFTQDFQYAAPSIGDLDLVAGVSYLQETAFQELVINLPLFLATSNPGADVDTRAYAAYAQGTYHFSEALRFTAGLRYSYEKREQDYLETLTDPLGALGAPGTFVLSEYQEADWGSLTPSFTLQYQIAPPVMVYGSASKGFKAGGFNSTAFQSSFDPENLWAFEIGEKGTFLDGRLQLNAAFFWYDYSDIQVLTLAPGAPTGAFPIVINAAAATIRGLEASVVFAATDNLKLEANAGYLDATFDSFSSIDPNNPLADPNREGQRMPQAPEFSFNLAATYTVDIASVGELTLRADMHHQSKIYFNSFADDVTSQKAYTVFNARAQLDLHDSGVYVAVFGNNLGDEFYAQTKVRQDPLIGLLNSWAPPRTFGIEIGVRFD